ncbi:MAG: TetR family transcriptional regulator [Vicinamibacteria bacterium]
MRSPRATSRPPAPGPAVRPLRLRKRDFVRDAILEAAIDLFAERGFDQTTVDDIVRAAGTSRRSFFRSFESKSDLLARPLVGFGESLREAVDACPPSWTTAEVLRETVLRAASGVAANPRSRTVMEITAKFPAAREALLARVAEMQDRVAGAFARRPGVPREAAPALGALVAAMVGSVCQSWFEGGDDVDLEKCVARVHASVVAALGGASLGRRKSSARSARRRPTR